MEPPIRAVDFEASGARMPKVKAAIIGSGNIGTDLMIKIKRNSAILELVAMVGVDPTSEGLSRAERLNVATTHEGIDGLLKMPEFREVQIVFDATSASAHHRHDPILRAHGKQVIDLTPAAVGPYVVPTVNLQDNLNAPNVNMVTCGGQATIPMVAAISRVTQVHYAEIVSSIASKSAGPGTRANIDEFTETTSRAIERVGGAHRGKAIIVLNPAEPPLMMRNTVFCLCETADEDAIRLSIDSMAQDVAAFVPGYRIKQEVVVQRISVEQSMRVPWSPVPFEGMKVSVFLVVEGAAHYLPAYAGNLDIMTSAAVQTAERLAELRKWSD
jgi:acetaldehyde dehydrogenase